MTGMSLLNGLERMFQQLSGSNIGRNNHEVSAIQGLDTFAIRLYFERVISRLRRYVVRHSVHRSLYHCTVQIKTAAMKNSMKPSLIHLCDGKSKLVGIKFTVCVLIKSSSWPNTLLSYRGLGLQK
jgi:hypothetical protein